MRVSSAYWQGRWGELRTSDRVDGLDGFLAAHDALAGDATDLRHTAPERRQKRVQRRGGINLSRLDSTVAFLDRFGAPEVRRRRPYR
jgi:hypothetical protein